MGWLLKLLGSGIVGIFGDAVLKPVLAHLDTKAAADRDVSIARIGADQQRDIALVQGQIEANRLKAGSQAAYPWIVYLIAVPPAIHTASVFFDSMPFWTPFGPHVVGAWGVPSPPGIYATMQQNILLTFFVVAPAVQAIKAATAAVARR